MTTFSMGPPRSVTPAATAGPATGLAQRGRALLRGSAGEAALGSRAAYFYALRRLKLLATVLLMRCGEAE